MDEMDMLKDALATPGPSSDTVRKGRGELEQLIRHHPAPAPAGPAGGWPGSAWPPRRWPSP